MASRQVEYVDFCSVEAFEPPVLSAGGGTRIAPAINAAPDLIDRRTQAYREAGIYNHRPIAVLLSDGKSENDTAEELAMVRQRLVSVEENRSLAFFAFGFQDSDVEALSRITPPNRPPLLYGDTEPSCMLCDLRSCDCMQRFSESDSGSPLPMDPLEWYLEQHVV